MPPRRGWTIAELLVTLGVISLLLALLAPAIQSARESARKIDCGNRLKQILLATEAFASNRQRYPEYSSGGIDQQGVRHWNVCPLVEILPYLDQAPLHDGIDKHEWFGAFDAYGSGQLYSGQNAQWVRHTIPLYQCPSDRQEPGSCNYRVSLGSGADWYTFSPGPPDPTCLDPKNGNGAFETMKALTPADVTDGLSTTVFYSERVIADGNGSQYDPWRDYSQVQPNWPHCTADELRSTCRSIAGVAPNHASFAGFTWIYATKAHTAYDHISPPNSRVPDCARDSSSEPGASNSAIAARSQHAGGVNAAMGDGSVRFASEQIDLAVWRQLGSRNGRD